MAVNFAKLPELLPVADAIQVSPRGIAPPRSDMSEVGAKPEVPHARNDANDPLRNYAPTR